MADNLGRIDIDCPICGRELHIPVTVTGPTFRVMLGKPEHTANLHLDQAYLDAHCLTHDQYDGEPLALAA